MRSIGSEVTQNSEMQRLGRPEAAYGLSLAVLNNPFKMTNPFFSSRLTRLLAEFDHPADP